MGKLIGYGKLGRSMPLSLDKCGNLGGDVEVIAVVRELALRHPGDTFLLLGRNSGELPLEAGLPGNIINPWNEWQWKGRLDGTLRKHGLRGVPLTPERQLKLADLFDEIVGPTFEQLDGMVMWIGQHGTSNTPLPKVGDPTQLTKPQDWCAWYSGFLLRGINRWRDQEPWYREEVNLNADPRNDHKMRDLKWPLRHPVLGQHNEWKHLKHARYGEQYNAGKPGAWADEPVCTEDIGQDTWRSKIYTTYARLEVNGLTPGSPFGNLISFNDDWHRSGDFGLFINETRVSGVRPELRRLKILKEWVLPLDPHFIHGTWTSADSAVERIKPAPWNQYYPKLHSVRCTFTTPASGSGWATAKPWEAFAAGTVCFFHPQYDAQNNILGDAPPALWNWLRVRSMEEMSVRIKHLSTRAGQGDWTWLVNAQRQHFEKAIEDLTYMRMIEDRI